MTSRNPRSATETWLEGLGSKFRTVRFYADGQWLDERHIDDPETLWFTVSLTLERFKLRYAIWPDTADRGWWVFDRHAPSQPTWYPSMEAAEMVVMHNG